MPRILIVDDEQHVRFLLGYAVQSLGCEADMAVNGEEALGKLHEGDYDLILLDLHMPGMDGMDVLRYLRDQHPHIPVIIVTAYGGVDKAVGAMKLGAADFIEKPFTTAEIREAVMSALSGKRTPTQAPRGYDERVALAQCLFDARDSAAAAEEARSAIALDPTRHQAFDLLAEVYEREGDVVQAETMRDVARVLRSHREERAMQPKKPED